jgi:hypothetical protein
MMSVTSTLSCSDGKYNTQIKKKSQFSLIEVEILARIKAADVSPKHYVIQTCIIPHTTETIQCVFLVVMFSVLFIYTLKFLCSLKRFFLTK